MSLVLVRGLDDNLNVVHWGSALGTELDVGGPNDRQETLYTAETAEIGIKYAEFHNPVNNPFSSSLARWMLPPLRIGAQKDPDPTVFFFASITPTERLSQSSDQITQGRRMGTRATLTNPTWGHQYTYQCHR